MGGRRYLLSVKPHFADLLLSGRKTVELRRPKLAIEPGDELFLYATRPLSQIVGVVVCHDVVYAPARMLWRSYKDWIGVSRKEFNAYFNGASSGTALLVNDAQRLSVPWALSKIREVFPGFHPPQSHMRLEGGLGRSLARRSLLKAT